MQWYACEHQHCKTDQKLPRLRILRTASMVGLMRALACELQVPPCRLRLWPVIHRENSTTRIDVLPERPVFAEYVRGQVFVPRVMHDANTCLLCLLMQDGKKRVCRGAS